MISVDFTALQELSSAQRLDSQVPTVWIYSIKMVAFLDLRRNNQHGQCCCENDILIDSAGNDDSNGRLFVGFRLKTVDLGRQIRILGVE